MAYIQHYTYKVDIISQIFSDCERGLTSPHNTGMKIIIEIYIVHNTANVAREQTPPNQPPPKFQVTEKGNGRTKGYMRPTESSVRKKRVWR